MHDVDMQATLPSLDVTPSTLRSGSWVTVSFTAPATELARHSSEYLCVQDSYCEDVARLSLWVGLFPRGANRSAIGPQVWTCGNPPWLATSPIKWKPLNATSGATRFHIESMRSPTLEFVLFSNGTAWPIELAISQPVRIIDSGRPQHIRLARTKSPSEMRVSWSAASFDSDAMVRWGHAPAAQVHSAPATAFTYEKGDLCGPPATAHGWMDAPWMFTSVVSVSRSSWADHSADHSADVVHYTVGSDAMGWSEERFFRLPRPPSRASSIHLTALADMGETYLDGAQYHWMEPFALNSTGFIIDRWGGAPGLTPLALRPAHPTGHVRSGKEGPPRGRVMAQLAEESVAAGSAPTDLVLHLGDLSYATGYESEWDRFMSQIEPLSSRAPYMTVLGNHERDYPGSGNDIGGADSGGECGVPTEARFLMPTQRTLPFRRGDKAWYSFEQGPVHFLMMDTETTAAAGTEQLAFVAADLAAVDRRVTPWVIVGGHRPMYSSSDAKDGYDLANGPWWPVVEDVFYRYEVDLCLWGHVHNAEATCPLRRGKCVTPDAAGGYDAPIHAIIGNAGQSLSPFTGTPPDWSLWRFAAFGFSTIEADGLSNKLTMNFYADCQRENSHDQPVTNVQPVNCSRANQLVHSFTIQRRADTHLHGARD